MADVTVREAEPAEHDEPREFFFPCDRWFETSLDDGKIERELVPGERKVADPEPEKEEEKKEEEKEEEKGNVIG